MFIKRTIASDCRSVWIGVFGRRIGVLFCDTCFGEWLTCGVETGCSRNVTGFSGYLRVESIGKTDTDLFREQPALAGSRCANMMDSSKRLKGVMSRFGIGASFTFALESTTPAAFKSG